MAKYASHGLETNNQKNRAKYLRTTNRGGGGGRDGSRTPRLRALVHDGVRCVGWMTGVGDNFFTNPSLSKGSTYEPAPTAEEVTSSHYEVLGEEANQMQEDVLDGGYVI